MAFFVNNFDHAEAGAHPGNTEPDHAYADPLIQPPAPCSSLLGEVFLSSEELFFLVASKYP